MKDESKKEKKLSRRGVLPFLGGGLLIPFLGFGNRNENENDAISSEEILEEEYQTLLKPDGTSVKVKVSTINKSKVIKKNVSNQSFLSWLGKKL